MEGKRLQRPTGPTDEDDEDGEFLDEADDDADFDEPALLGYLRELHSEIVSTI
jgi:hypothetical protein